MKPYFEEDGIIIYHMRSEEFTPEVADKWYDLCFADPPYGIDKAPWDSEYPAGFEAECLRIARIVAITPGMWALPQCLAQVRSEYQGIICGRNLNGMTFSPLGFGNWIPTVIAGEKPSSGPDALEFVVNGEKEDHPSPKPYQFMKRLILRLTLNDDLIIDPFMGSGTTLRAAKDLGRKAVGVEIDERYCEIAAKRLSQKVFAFE